MLMLPSHPFSPSPCKSGSKAQTRPRLLQHHLSCSSLDGATSPLHHPFSAGRDDKSSPRTHQQICWTLFPCPHLSPMPLPAERTGTRAQLLRWRWSRADPKCQGGRSSDFCPHILAGAFGNSLATELNPPAALGANSTAQCWRGGLGISRCPRGPPSPLNPRACMVSPPVPLPGSFSISHASSIGCEDEEVSPVSAWCWARR